MMNKIGLSGPFSLSIIALFLLTAPVLAQTTPPWPNGCSVPLGPWVANGLGRVFLGSCTAHDLCWGQCNGPNPPFLGTAHKVECDLRFLANMESAFLLLTPLVALPFGQINNITDFLEHCTEVAVTFYIAVATPLTNGNFRRSQCRNGCNRDACTQEGIEFPAECNMGQCYPAPQLPPAGGLSCAFVPCDQCLSVMQQMCCSECAC
jgi:hypothetical protein